MNFHFSQNIKKLEEKRYFDETEEFLKKSSLIFKFKMCVIIFINDLIVTKTMDCCRTTDYIAMMIKNNNCLNPKDKNNNKLA